MAGLESENIYGIRIRESANDGSDFSSPPADYRLAFLGEDGLWHVKDSSGTVTDPFSGAGSVATDAIWDAAGDLAVGSGANTAAKLAIGATNGMAVRRVSGAVAWDFPPGHEFDYVEYTSSVSVTATTEAGANTVVTANAVTLSSQTVIVEFYAPNFTPVNTANATISLWLYDGASSIGRMAFHQTVAANNDHKPVLVRRRLSSITGTKTYSIRASVSSTGGSVGAGAGGAGNSMPGYIRITAA